MPSDPRFLWLIQENQEDRSAVQTVKDVLDELHVHWIGIHIDFKSPVLPSLDGLQSSDRVLCFGPSFIPRLDHRNPAWRPASIFNPDSFRWSQFNLHWPGKMLSRDGLVLSVGAFRAAPACGTVFARPDADSKTFDGGVRSHEELGFILHGLNDELRIVIASPTPIDAEYRVFMIASEVVAASEYRRNGQISINGFVPNQAVDLALEADRIWKPEEAYVIDVARSGERFGIVEANCITAARQYGADGRAIVAALCYHYGVLSK